MLFLKGAAPLYNSTSSSHGYPFYYIPTNACYFSSFMMAILTGERLISHCDFHLHFPDDYGCGISFYVFVGHLGIFEKMSIQFLCPLFFGLFVIGLLSSYSLDINILSDILFLSFRRFSISLFF